MSAAIAPRSLPRARLCGCRDEDRSRLPLERRLADPDDHDPECPVRTMRLRLEPRPMPDQIGPWEYDAEQLGYRATTTQATGPRGRVVETGPRDYYVRGLGLRPFSDSWRGRMVRAAFCE